jgi:hypothetical protein
MHWSQLWELLPDRRRVGLGWQPSAPLILAAWWETTDQDKQQRLIAHIQWAHDHGELEQVNQYLRSLSEDQWHHIGE